MRPDQPTTGETAFLALVRARGLRPPADRFLRQSLRRLGDFFADGVLRERIAGRRSLLGTIDPRARLLGVLLYLVSLSLAVSPRAVCLHALIPLAALALARLRPREILAGGLLPALCFTLVMAAPATLNLVHPGRGVLPLLSFATPRALHGYGVPGVIGVTREGLLAAAVLLLRVMASVGMVLWLSLSTRWVELLRALRALRIPAVVLQVAGMTVRYLHALLRQSEEAHLGKRSRTIGRSPLRIEQAWAGSRIALTWQRAVHLMDEVGQAMTARGFTGEVRLPTSSRFGLAEWTFLGTLAIACLAAHTW